MVAQETNMYIALMDAKRRQKEVICRASDDNGQTFSNPIMAYGSAVPTISPSTN
jgi:hypothetical protein